jgi:hypothetical protein
MNKKWKKSLLILVGGALAALATYRAFIYAPPVEVVNVKEGIVKSEVRAPGTLQARIPVSVSVRLTGILKEVKVDQGDSVVAGQSLVLTVASFAFAYALVMQTYDKFPRTLFILPADTLITFAVMLAGGVLASLLGVWQALRTPPSLALGG